jgi:hypothetical protein
VPLTRLPPHDITSQWHSEDRTQVAPVLGPSQPGDAGDKGPLISPVPLSSKALVKGLTRELEINESYLEKLAEEVRKDLG